ncbi:hypothetical protein LOC72_08845 [Roseiconus lacunae]|nr:hypothetical protein [Roseiconus lacunae]
MKRRHLLTLGAASVCCSAAPNEASAADQHRLHKFLLGSPFNINRASPPITYREQPINIIRLDSGTLHLDANDRLVGKIHAHVAQYNDINLDVSFAVFDENTELLGTARHTEVVRKVYISAMMATTENWIIDFGRSKTFHNASKLAVAFHDVPVPNPFEKGEPADARESPS